ncbi:MAG: deoxynucleoside kinase [Deltaproteobacteria bacterium]|nr:deoxynucleoside kinase [Deltaproteobacteria bacterium]
MAKKYIAIAGNMGSGKSSLVDFFCRECSFKPFYEPNDLNPYLADFYKDMKKWAYHSQLHFLTHKFRIHQELDRSNGTVVQDRTIYEDAEIFCTNLYRSGFVGKRDYQTYMDLYKTILKSLQPPSVMIYLTCPLRTLKKRIAKRGRQMEKNVPDAYLKRLEKLYKNWISKYDISPIIKVSTEKYDYMDDFITRQQIMNELRKYL